jgi:hypothetical protein
MRVFHVFVIVKSESEGVDRKSEIREEKEREKEKDCHRCGGCTYAFCVCTCMCSSCIFHCQERVRRGGQEEREPREEKVRERERERYEGCTYAFKWNFDVFFNCCFDDMGMQIWHSNLLVQP